MIIGFNSIPVIPVFDRIRPVISRIFVEMDSPCFNNIKVSKIYKGLMCTYTFGVGKTLKKKIKEILKEFPYVGLNPGPTACESSVFSTRPRSKLMGGEATFLLFILLYSASGDFEAVFSSSSSS